MECWLEVMRAVLIISASAIEGEIVEGGGVGREAVVLVERMVVSWAVRWAFWDSRARTAIRP